MASAPVPVSRFLPCVLFMVNCRLSNDVGSVLPKLLLAMVFLMQQEANQGTFQVYLPAGESYWPGLFF